MKNKITNMLWTGGWDSTFQLLQLLVDQKVSVTPFYLIDEERRSTGVEILTMRRIKSHLQNHFPDARQLLNATQYFAVGDIAPNPNITEAYKRIRDKSFIGSQYEWLARFCEEHKICDLQLCVEKAGSSKAYALLSSMVKEVIHEGHNTFKVSENFSNTDEYAVFKYFSFPIFDLTKTEMVQVAREQGLDKIMNMTWFCHKPIKGKPCGKCNPCISTIEEGLGGRIGSPKTHSLSFYAYSSTPFKEFRETGSH